MPRVNESLRQARALGLGYYMAECKMHGLVRRRLKKSGGECPDCARERAARNYHADPDKFRARSRAWGKANPEKALDRALRWAKANPEKARATAREYARRNAEKNRARVKAWRLANPGRLRETINKRRKAYPEQRREAERRLYLADPAKVQARTKRWERANPEKAKAVHHAMAALRRARKINAAPAWLTVKHRREMRAIYRQAQDLGLTVDHVIPLAGCKRCGAHGLHVPWNLQLLGLPENSAKHNRCADCFAASAAQPEDIAA